jgi:Cys-rich protein (TIGR01571 family)
LGTLRTVHDLLRMANDWTYPLDGCFDEPRICLLAYAAPCILIGENASYLGEDKLTYFLLSGILHLFRGLPCLCCYLNLRINMRTRIREQRGIEVSYPVSCTGF